MKHRLNLDIKDPNYTLLKEIFKIMDSRKSLEILASYGFKNLNKQIFCFKIIFIQNVLWIRHSIHFKRAGN